MFDHLFKPKTKKGLFDFDVELFPSQEERAGRCYISKADRIKLWKKQKGRCAICKRKLDPHNYHIDHKKPLALGGKNTLSNLQLLCPNCHSLKSKEDQKKIAEKRKQERAKDFLPKVEFDLPSLGLDKGRKSKRGKRKRKKGPFDIEIGDLL